MSTQKLHIYTYMYMYMYRYKCIILYSLLCIGILHVYTCRTGIDCNLHILIIVNFEELQGFLRWQNNYKLHIFSTIISQYIFKTILWYTGILSGWEGGGKCTGLVCPPLDIHVHVHVLTADIYTCMYMYLSPGFAPLG